MRSQPPSPSGLPNLRQAVEGISPTACGPEVRFLDESRVLRSIAPDVFAPDPVRERKAQRQGQRSARHIAAAEEHQAMGYSNELMLACQIGVLICMAYGVDLGPMRSNKIGVSLCLLTSFACAVLLVRQDRYETYRRREGCTLLRTGDARAAEALLLHGGEEAKLALVEARRRQAHWAGAKVALDRIWELDELTQAQQRSYYAQRRAIAHRDTTPQAGADAAW